MRRNALRAHKWATLCYTKVYGELGESSAYAYKTIRNAIKLLMLYNVVLPYSSREAGRVCFSESFESLSYGMQEALWELGEEPKAYLDGPVICGGTEHGTYGGVYAALWGVIAPAQMPSLQYVLTGIKL